MPDIVSVMNRPRKNGALIEEVGGIPLDRVLFPSLAGIECFEPVGLVEFTARGWMNMSGVTDEEHATDMVAIDRPRRLPKSALQQQNPLSSPSQYV